MCGIVGIVDTLGRRPIERPLLHRMNEAQHHRGPDGGGLHLSPGVGLGHRRLAIIDVASGRQPLYNEDGKVVVVFNGEIYNHEEIARELRLIGHTFRTRSDTEVIVHGWEAWGERCVERFRGMFAFALWDERQQTLFLARDRLGVKPLHYAALPDGRFIFGSELKALAVVGGFDVTHDPAAVEDYFTLGYIPEPRTIYAGARKLPAGHSLTVQRGRPLSAPVRYWDVRFSPIQRVSPEGAVQELVARLAECVRLRMVAEVPLGAFLSGGVDSSAVVAMMAQASASPVRTCSIGFADPEFDETGYALQVATRYGTTHATKRVASDDVSLIDALASLYDEPYADSSAIPTYRVCELARRHVTVALSGDGGDESFGGYRRYRSHLAEERLRSRLPLALRRMFFGTAAALYPKADWAPRPLRAKATFAALARDSLPAYLDAVSVIRSPLRTTILTGTHRTRTAGYRTIDAFQAYAAQAETDDPLALVQYLDLKTYLPGDINTKVDRASMAHGLEVREPLMDHRLVEWLATLPSALKVRGSEGKWLLKKALEPYLPAEIMYRPKRGFAVPLASWFRGPLRDRLRDSVLGERLLDTGLFNRTAIAQLLDEHQARTRDHSAALWTMLLFDSFLRRSDAAGQVAPALATESAGVSAGGVEPHGEAHTQGGAQ